MIRHVAEIRIPIDIPEFDAVMEALGDISTRQTAMEAKMSELSDAVAGVVSRVDEDFAHLRDLLEQALATETSNEAEIARLREEAATVGADISSAVSELNAVDPDASNPEPPAGGGGVDDGGGQPPVDTPVEPVVDEGPPVQ